MRCERCQGTGVTDRATGELCPDCGGYGQISCCEGAENVKCYCKDEKPDWNVLPAGNSIFVNEGYLIYTAVDTIPSFKNGYARAAFEKSLENHEAKAAE